MRNSAHEKGLWRFVITDQGFRVMDKLEGVSGLLGWTVLSDNPARDPIARRKSRRRSEQSN
jgi:hypothetical protein